MESLEKETVGLCKVSQKVSEYDQEMLQLHTADQPMAPWGRATEHISNNISVKQ